LRSSPPASPVRLPSAPTTRWHGTITDSGLRAFAAPTACASDTSPNWGTADLIAEGDYVVGRWEGGGTHTGAAFDDLPIGSLPEASGKAMRFTGTTTLKLHNGLIVEEIGFDDGVKALRQLGIILAA
jgi:predicted ester cyclase